MSKKFLPLAGIATALAIVSYVLLSLIFPHKQEAVVDTGVKAEDVFSAQLNEAEAQPTAITAEQSEVASVPAEGSATAETAPAEIVAEAPAEAAPEAAPAETTPAPAETVAAEAPVEAPAEPVVEAAPVEAAAPTETASSTPGLSRDQLAKIVAEAAAQAAAETAKSIAEKAAREAAAR